MTAIFISHSSADSAAAAEVKAWLQAQGHTSLFLDFDPEAGIKAGAGWEQTLYQKLRQCQAVIALLTPNWLASKWCFAELVQARERGKAIFPVKVQSCDATGVFGDIQHIDLTTDNEQGYERLRIGLLERGLDPLDAYDWNPKRPPYPGLLAFEEQDAAIYFGRGEDIVKALEILDVLRRHGSDTARLVLLLGASGSGKSSLVRAGVIPRLKKKKGEWLPLPPFRPQVEPIDELAMTLATGFESVDRPRDWNSIRTALHEAASRTPADGGVLLDILRELAIAARQQDATVLLTIDQAEELFGYTPSEAVTRFLQLLRAALETDNRRLMAVATLRSDFLGEFQNHPVLQDCGYQHHFRYRVLPVDPMPIRSFPEVIRGPGRLAGLQLDDGLVESMVNDTASRDALPLLAFTLRRLHERFGATGRFTLEQYESLGRLEGAIREEAERLIADAKPAPDELDALHTAFVPTMVRINAEGAYARRRALVNDLPRRVIALLRRFIDARLVVADRDSEGRETAEVAHEALLRTWPQLSDWLMEDRDNLRALESLQRAADEWQQRGRTDDLLIHRDARLEAVEALAGNPRFSMPDASVERAYLNRCRLAQQAREAVAKQEQERRIRDAERIAEEQTKAALAQKRAAMISRRFTYVALGLFAITAIAAVVATQQYAEATAANNRVSEVQKLARYTSDVGAKPQRNLLLSVRAASLGEDEQDGTLFAIDGLRQQMRVTGGIPLRGPRSATRVAAFSLDRHWLATGSDDGSIRLWDVSAIDPANHAFLLDKHEGPVRALAFSPDGQWLISGGADGWVRLWRVTAQGAEMVREFGAGRYGAIQSIAIHPRGDWLAFGTQNGNLCTWKMSAQGPVETPCDAWKDDLPVMNVTFSPQGRWLATSCSGGCKDYGAPVRLWDLSARSPDQKPVLLTHATDLGHEHPLMAFAFNHDETRIAVAYGYVTEVWDLTQEHPPQHVTTSIGGSGGWIRAVSLSADNRWLAVGSYGTDVVLQDLTGTHREPIALRGHGAAVTSIAFSDDGRWLTTGSEDGTARAWDLSDPTMPSTVLRGSDLPIGKVVVSPGAPPLQVVTLGDEAHARLWNLRDPLADPRVLRANVKPIIMGMAVSPDGRWIATSSLQESKLVLWSTKDPRRPVDELPMSGASRSIAFSPDGRWLAAKSQDHRVIALWSLPDRSKPPLQFREQSESEAKTLVFSKDSRWLVSGTWAGIVNIWEVLGDSPSLEPRHSCNQGEPVREMDFSADGRLLATAAHGFSARLWELSSPDPCANPVVLPHADVIYQVAVSADSRWAATASFDSKGRLWDLKSGSEPKLISELTFKDRVLQAMISPDDRWVAFGSWDTTLKLIDLKNAAASKAIDLVGHAARIRVAAFSPDGKWLASGSEDRTIRLWHVEQADSAPVILRGHQASVTHIGFSADSRWVITGGEDGTVRLWRLRLSDLMDLACQIAGRDFTPEEAEEFLSDENARTLCSERQATSAHSSSSP